MGAKSYLFHEGRLADIGVARHEERAGVGINGRETAKVLTDLLEVLEWLLHALDERAHATKAGALQLLAAVKRVTELEETQVVLGDVVNVVLGGVHLAQSELVVIAVIENVHKIAVERVHIL